MPISPEQADAISKLSVAALLVLALVFVIVGLARKWFVPGWLYTSVETRATTAETQAALTAASLEVTNASMARLVTELAGVRREMKVLRDDLRKALSAADRA